MLKKVTHLLLALLMVIQILIPTTAFANEAEEYEYADVDAMELVDPDTDEDDVDLEIEIDDNEEDQLWTDAELAEWDELLADNTKIRNRSVYLLEDTAIYEDAEDLHARHVALYEIADELREDDVFELDFIDATEVLIKNTVDFEALVADFEALLDTALEREDVEIPETDVVPEVERATQVFTVTGVNARERRFAGDWQGSRTFTAHAGETVTMTFGDGVSSSPLFPGSVIEWRSNVPGLSLTPGAGSGDLLLERTVTFIMPSRNVTITAEPAQTRGRVTVVNGTGGRENVASGSTVNVRANVPAGYTFHRWVVVGGNDYGTIRDWRQPNASFTVSRFAPQGFNVRLEAQFIKNRPNLNMRMQATTARETTLRLGPGSNYQAAPLRPAGGTESRVRRNTAVTIRRMSGSWSYIQITGTSNNREGWVRTRDLTVNTQRMGIIVNHRVRLRASPNGSARTLTRLNRNTEVTIISRGRGSSSGWTQIRSGGRTGWVRNIELENFTQMRRTRRAVTMRSGPGSHFGSVRNIRNGRNVTVLGRSGNWLQVRYNGRVGWIQNNRTSRTATRRIRSAGIQPLRREARAGSRTTWTNHLPRNTRVTVLGRDGRSSSGFTRVRIGNRTGWLWTSWLR